MITISKIFFASLHQLPRFFTTQKKSLDKMYKKLIQIYDWRKLID